MRFSRLFRVGWLSPLLLAACANLLGIKEADLDADSSVPRGGFGAFGGSGNGVGLPPGGLAQAGKGPASGGSAGFGVAGAGAPGGASQGGTSAGSVITPPSCGVKFNSECLQTCSDANCCVEQQKCIGNAACSKLLDCADACADDICREECQSKYSEGTSLLSAMQTCQRTQCSLCPGPATDNAIAVFAQTDCSKYQACDPVTFALGFGSVSECITRKVTNYRWIYSLPGVAWAASVFNACTYSYASLTCEDYVNGIRTEACTASGTLALGAPCNDSAQCQSSFCNNDYLTCGVCAKAPAENAACVSGRCSPGFTCVVDGTCQRQRSRGERCSAIWPCQSTLNCYGDYCTDPPANVGAACDPEVGLLCDRRKSLTCGTVSKTCAPIAKYDIAGQSCGADPGGDVSLCAMGSCQSGSCVALAKDHAPCDDKHGPLCEWPATCAFGICRLGSDVAGCVSTP